MPWGKPQNQSWGITGPAPAQPQGLAQGKGLQGGKQRAWSCLKHPPAHPRHQVLLPHTELAPQHPWYPGRMRAAAPGGEEEEEEEQLLGSAAAGRHPGREFAIPQPCPMRWMHPGQHKTSSCFPLLPACSAQTGPELPPGRKRRQCRDSSEQNRAAGTSPCRPQHYPQNS